MTKLKIFYNILPTIPFIFYLSFIIFILRAKDKLGYIPYYGHPDPKILNFDIHMLIVYLFGFATVISFFLWLTLSIYFLYKKKLNIVNILSYGLSWFIVYFVINFYYLNDIIWFLD